jgi:Integral membrane protein possibly involved in chromosome condensation
MAVNFLLVAAGAAFGVLARVLATKYISRKWEHAAPLATFLINLSGSFILGCLTGMNIGTQAALLLGTGFIGTYTTFSTFNVENIELIRRKKSPVFLLYAGSTYVFGILAAGLGVLLGTLIR